MADDPLPHPPPRPPAPAARLASALAPRTPTGPLRRALRRLRILARLRRLYWLRLKLLLIPAEGQRLFVLTVAIGACCGLAAVAFHLAIRFAEGHLIDRAVEAPGRSWIAWTIACPTLGGLACGALLHWWVPAARGSGIPEVKAAWSLRGRAVRLRDAAGKFVIAALQLGSGASLGREGPTVQICAGLAAQAGRLARLAPRNVRRLLPVGAAAGVAAAFNAPLAAVTFTLEEIVGDLDKGVLTGVIVAAAVAAVVERGVLGEHPVLDFPAGHAFRHLPSLALFVALGVAAALVAVAFTDALLRLRAGARRWRLVPAWSRPAVGGLATGLLAVAALATLDARGIAGGGYATLEAALRGDVAVRAMLGLCALKLAATVACYGTGASGGIFAPSLFIGGMLGGAFGTLDQFAFGHEGAVARFALVGMGAAFAAIVRAPMTSVLIIVEMTGGYSLILPLMISNMIAYGLARRLRPRPIYDALLDQDGIHLRPTAGLDALENVRLEQVLARDARFVCFAEAARGDELLAARAQQEAYPVVEAASGRLIGVVTDEELALLAAQPGLVPLVTASDLMRGPVAVRRRDDLRSALEAMLAHGLRRLPVIDEEGRVAGLVDEAAIARAYLRGNVA